MDDDTVIALRRHGNPAGPRLVLSHGSGLAIDLYYPFWSLLTDEFDVVIYDLRNHGWNTVGKLRKHNIPTLIRDHDRILKEIDRYFGEKPKIGIFHSVSALITLLSPSGGGEYSARVLFDPPLCKPDDGYAEFERASKRVAAMTRRRTDRFPTREAFAEFLPYLPIFQRVVPGVCDLMAETTLRASAGGKGFVLRCPPEFEAQLVDYARAFAVLVDFAKLRCPTKVIGADPMLPYSYLPTMDMSNMLTVDYDFIPEATHLLQLEQPQECVAAMREFIDPFIRS